jgi:hypothetical protein
LLNANRGTGVLREEAYLKASPSYFALTAGWMRTVIVAKGNAGTWKESPSKVKEGRGPVTESSSQVERMGKPIVARSERED